MEGLVLRLTVVKNRKMFLACFQHSLAWSLFRRPLPITLHCNILQFRNFHLWKSLNDIEDCTFQMVVGPQCSSWDLDNHCRIIAFINVTDFNVWFFGMGIWLGGFLSVYIVNRSRKSTHCNCFCYYVRTRVLWKAVTDFKCSCRHISATISS